jgi:ABC-type glutathione transport system ATPase component
MILEVKNLSVKYSQGPLALDNVNFAVDENELLALVGESGSGKSTFASTAMGLLPFDALKKGQIIFEGQNVLDLNEKGFNSLRAIKISLIMQDHLNSFNPFLTLGYQLHELLRVRLRIASLKERGRLIHAALEQVSFVSHKNILTRYPHEFSGGELARMSLAAALSLRPKLIIADEPTSSLDVVTESRIVKAFKDLKEKSKITFIFITHNLGLVKVLADKVVVLQKGKVRETGTVETIFNAPQDEYTKELINSFNDLEG